MLNMPCCLSFRPFLLKIASLNATSQQHNQQDDKCDDVVYFLLMTNLGIETHLCYVLQCRVS